MLKYRTSGSDKVRRTKVKMYKDAMIYAKDWMDSDAHYTVKDGALWHDYKYNSEEKLKKDETIKAVSNVSYHPLSALNRQMFKHKKDLLNE